MDTLEKPWGGDKPLYMLCGLGNLLGPSLSCTTPLPSPSLQMSNATRAVPSPVAPGTPGPGTAARLASAPPFSAVALLTAAHNTSEEGQQLFLTTTAAQVISGIFVWSALIVTFHQVRAAAEVGLSTGVVMRAKLLIAPKSFANYSALGKYFFLLLPVISLLSGAWCWQLIRMDFAHTLPRWLPEPGGVAGNWHCPEETPGGAFGCLGCTAPAALRHSLGGHGLGGCAGLCC